ncbi:hypothetical protein I553_4056 [Mycobacterium xenopi 4042]|uniref:Uncharacterized protein n=1 Tax=Mycobacterium xenopi 4042 TaxID=1299334 RepID=X7YZN7_MYCXE|nr:hypothetical protein I553_4056 [Mycobacterium xenopi 4042]
MVGGQVFRHGGWTPPTWKRGDERARSGDAPRASRRRAIAVVVAAWSPRVW